MSKPEWGIRRTCQSCKTLFYDMKKDPIVCPKCKTTYDVKALLVANPIDGHHRQDEKLQDKQLDHDLRFEDDLFLDQQEDFLESLEELEELEDRLEPHEMATHSN